ncbi:MAG: hypothetical protein H6502_03360 [Candidatus Woesearchaeota archaeon]|nr:MAG: hypothetical protein H6502_03360 [Candidatus Woesearchaeota archaeon]
MENSGQEHMMMLLVGVVAFIAIIGMLLTFSAPLQGDIAGQALKVNAKTGVALSAANNPDYLGDHPIKKEEIATDPYHGSINPVELPEEVEDFAKVDFEKLDVMRQELTGASGRSTITQEIVDYGSILLSSGNHVLGENINLTDETHIFLEGNAVLNCQNYTLSGSGLINDAPFEQNWVDPEDITFGIALSDNARIINCDVAHFQINVISEDNAAIINGRFDHFRNYGVYVTGSILMQGSISASYNAYDRFPGENPQVGFVLYQVTDSAFEATLTATRNNDYGIFMKNTANNNFEDPIDVSYNGFHGLVLWDESEDNTFYSVTANANNGNGMLLGYGSDDNAFTGTVTANENGLNGVELFLLDRITFEDEVTANGNENNGVLARAAHVVEFADQLTSNSNNEHGVYFLSSSSSEFLGQVTAVGNDGDGIRLDSASGADFIGRLSIGANEGSGLVVRNTYLANFGTVYIGNNDQHGIELYNVGQGLYYDVYFGNVTSLGNFFDGLHMTNSRNVWFDHVDVYNNNDAGIFIDQGNEIHFTNISATMNDDYGVYIKDVSDISLMANDELTMHVSNSQTGFYMENVSNFASNGSIALYSNDLGLHLIDTPYNFNVWYWNNIQDYIIDGTDLIGVTLTGDGTGTGVDVDAGVLGALPDLPLRVSNFAYGAIVSGDAEVGYLIATGNTVQGVRLEPGATVTGAIYSCNSEEDGSGGFDLIIGQNVTISPSATFTFDSCAPASICATLNPDPCPVSGGGHGNGSNETGPRPDFQPADIHPTLFHAYNMSNATTFVAVRNLGEINSEAPVRLSIINATTNVVVWTNTQNRLFVVGNYSLVYFTLPQLLGGVYTVQAVVDPNGVVDELDETNNVRTETFIID